MLHLGAAHFSTGRDDKKKRTTKRDNREDTQRRPTDNKRRQRPTTHRTHRHTTHKVMVVKSEFKFHVLSFKFQVEEEAQAFLSVFSFEFQVWRGEGGTQQ